MTATASLFDPSILAKAARSAIVKLNPVTLIRNPVMFVVEVGALLCTALLVRDAGTLGGQEIAFSAIIATSLWFTVLFANLAEAVAEGRGKAQADTLRAARSETVATLRLADGTIMERAVRRASAGRSVRGGLRVGHTRRR